MECVILLDVYDTQEGVCKDGKTHGPKVSSVHAPSESVRDCGLKDEEELQRD